MAQKDFSIKVLQEIEEKLTNLGLSFGMSVHDIAHTCFILMPWTGVSGTSACIQAWKVCEGEQIEKDRHLFDFETEKCAFEEYADYTGTILKIVVPAGEEVAVGTPVAVMKIKSL